MVTDDDVHNIVKHGPARRSQTEPAGGGEEYLRIEQVAARTGLTKRTLRYYEEIGLLAAPSRTEGGYRLYSAHDIQELERIKRLKKLLGFSLAEIREIAQAEEEREHVRAAWIQEPDPRARLELLDRLEAQQEHLLLLVDEKRAGLEEMRHNMMTRRERWQALRAELNAQMGKGGEQ
ncbi:MAG TPA: MerR family transcriptional regulator [Ktedonobacterales bacterium]|nr:MerR family transcriptional regulator [Ktedonobacterales bacterium]